MLYWEDPDFIAWENRERYNKRKGINFQTYRASQDRHLMRKIDPAILDRMRTNAKSGKRYEPPIKESSEPEHNDS